MQDGGDALGGKTTSRQGGDEAGGGVAPDKVCPLQPGHSPCSFVPQFPQLFTEEQVLSTRKLQTTGQARRQLWGQGTWPHPPPWGLGRGEAGSLRRDPGVQAMVGAQLGAFWMGKGRRRGRARVKPQAVAGACWHRHPWVFGAPSPSAAPSGHPGGVGVGVVNSCTWGA